MQAARSLGFGQRPSTHPADPRISLEEVWPGSLDGSTANQSPSLLQAAPDRGHERTEGTETVFEEQQYAGKQGASYESQRVKEERSEGCMTGIGTESGRHGAHVEEEHKVMSHKPVG